MSEPVQLDLFGDYEETPEQPALNGMYTNGRLGSLSPSSAGAGTLR